ncbi:MAG: hypothetical protein REH79_02855 [Spiroplasma sp.]|nr:hypothetical protein [Spiroplasma sp.]
MTCYEIVSTIISIFSLLATIFFGFAVLKLSKKANEIAQESNKLQEKLIASSVDQRVNIVKEEVSDASHENVAELNKDNKILEKQLAPYTKGMNRVKADEYKEWKQKNNKLKKRFLSQKK